MPINEVLIPVKDSQRMFFYGGNKYRFISSAPLEVGDPVKIGSHQNGEPHILPIKEVIEARPEKVEWATPKFSNTIVV
jgi:hypothetical protein